MTRRTVGGTDLRRFVLSVLPPLAAALLLVPAIVMGWVSVTIASSDPIGIRTSHGTAASLYLAPSSDVGVLAVRMEDEPRGAALISITEAELDDLCLVPRVGLPLVDRALSVRVSTTAPVRLGEVDLAASRTVLDGLHLRSTSIGDPEAARRRGPASGFAVSSTEDVLFEDLDAAVYGLVLEGGLRVDTLSLRGGLGHC